MQKSDEQRDKEQDRAFLVLLIALMTLGFVLCVLKYEGILSPHIPWWAVTLPIYMLPATFLIWLAVVFVLARWN